MLLQILGMASGSTASHFITSNDYWIEIYQEMAERHHSKGLGSGD